MRQSAEFAASDRTAATGAGDGMDDDGFAAFAAREHGRLVGALALYTGDAHVAEDLAHDALARALERWDEVRDTGSPAGWLYRVAFNQAHSHYRRREVERRILRRFLPTPQADHAGTTETVVAVRAALRRLPPRQRQIIVLRYFLGLDVRQTADHLGLDAGSVKSHTHRAFKRLKPLLGEFIPAEVLS